MFPCHGVTTANAWPFGVPAVSRYGSPARPSFLARPAFLSLRDPAFHPEKKSLALRVGADLHSRAISASFVKYDSIKGIKPLLSARSLNPRPQVTCQASLSSFSYPELETKPKWWWRTLACVPYLLPLHNMWSNADAIYQLHPYLQRFNLLYAFIDTMALLPGWLFLVIFMTIYFSVVRRGRSGRHIFCDFTSYWLSCLILVLKLWQQRATGIQASFFRANQWRISG